jgi:hypothetical protein
MNNRKHIHLDLGTCPLYFRYYLLTSYEMNLMVASPHSHFIDHSSDRSSLMGTRCQKPPSRMNLPYSVCEMMVFNPFFWRLDEGDDHLRISSNNTLSSSCSLASCVLLPHKSDRPSFQFWEAVCFNKISWPLR